MRAAMKLGFVLVVLSATLAASPCARAEWGPPEIAVQGILSNLADEPTKGPVDLTFSLYDGVDGIQPLWTETHKKVPLTVGRFDLLLGSVKALDNPPLFEQFDNLWVGISVNGGPELPRAPLSAVGYAMQARHAVFCDQLSSVPSDLECTGCVGAKEIADGSIGLGDFGPNGCTPGQVIKRNAGGTAWECGKDNDTGYAAGFGITLANGQVSVDKAALAPLYVEPDEENSVSMEMIQKNAVTNDKIASVSWNKLTEVPGGFADGIDNEGVLIEVDPTIGSLVAGKWCASDGNQVTCDQDPPVYTEVDPEVGANQTGYVPKWNGSALVAGSIYDDGKVGIGMVNPAGKLQVAGGVVRIGVAGTADVATGDGDLYVQDALEVDGEAQIAGTVTASGALNVKGAADFAGVVDLHQDLDLNAHKVEKMATPTAADDGANKGYVDGQVSSAISAAPAIVARARRYTVVLGLNDGAYCPQGWTLENVDAYKGPDNNLYIDINDHGLFMGGINSAGYGQAHLYVRVNSTSGMTKVCWRTFTSSSGNPHFSLLAFGGGDQSLCPAGHTYIPKSKLQGSNGWAYAMANKGGAYLGYEDSWSYGSHDYADDTGYQYRTLGSTIGGVCFRVMGVDEDPATRDGVFPVVLGLMDPAGCPTGWNIQATSVIDGSNDWFYLQLNDNASFLGGLNDWGHGGNDYMQVHFQYSHVSFVCWNHLVRQGLPFHHIRTPQSGNCPAGYTSVSAGLLKGWNANGYIAAHGHAMYMGGLYGWGMHDHTHGYIQHNFTNQVLNKVCFKVEGVK